MPKYPHKNYRVYRDDDEIRKAMVIVIMHYNGAGEPVKMQTLPALKADSVVELRQLLDHIASACKKPVLAFKEGMFVEINR